MRSPAEISAQLQSLADDEHARRLRQHSRPMRGLRGVKGPDIGLVLRETWEAGPIELPMDAAGLGELFVTAFEDGLVAIGLAAARLPTQPREALELGMAWAEMADDVQTADAIGWLLVGPGLLLSAPTEAAEVLQEFAEAGPSQRRVALAACLAALPVPVEGPAAAALRLQMGVTDVAFVEAPLDTFLDQALEPFLRDAEPQVRKGVGRILRAWATFSPEAATSRANRVPGGIARQLRDDLEEGLEKAEKLAKKAAREAKFAAKRAAKDQGATDTSPSR